MARSVQAGSVSSYFRQIFDENRDLLATTNNDEILKRFTELSGRASTPKDRAILSNLKSQLRKKHAAGNGTAKRRGRPPKAKATAAAAPSAGSNRLEKLEEAIDECMIRARDLDPMGLGSVIEHLRKARNAVVLRQGHK